MSPVIAKIAVSAATYWIDRPYDYFVPEEMVDKIRPGMRVSVPFARGNRRCEGLVLALSEHSEFENLKPIEACLDSEPVLSSEQIKLALFMRNRFFCTVYDAAKAMLPAGLWFDSEGKQRTGDKLIEMATITASAEETRSLVISRRMKSPKQAELLEELCSFQTLPVRELLSHTGASRQSLKSLENAGLVCITKREVYRRPEIYAGELYPLPQLNDEQQRAFEGLYEQSNEGASCALLFGVTGSGKTSVYVHLISRKLEQGKSVILLVPEIALTPQMIQTFSCFFGNEVAVLHSSLSSGERLDEWKRIRNGEARLVIGTRSAVFAPVVNLGLIIIDEEQEESYKSENSPRYNARDVAKFRCNKAFSMLLLGSATPDVCSMYAASTGQYKLYKLEHRYNEKELPEVFTVDMKRELRYGNGSDISTTLYKFLKENIEKGEQSILFINRRGANKLVSCVDCGYTYRCPNCSVSMTYHRYNGMLMCHYCGRSIWPDEACPVCTGTLRYVGTGTENVEQQIREIFPEIDVLRVDTDSLAPAGSHDKLFSRFVEENIPVMVGTQMVTKGLNFDNVTLVGVLNADQSLYSGNYRAGERSFSLITQVIGRSGRGSKPGRAVIQTYTPENETILHASNQDYEAFYRSEIELRKLQNVPPFADILSITVSGSDEHQVKTVCERIRDRLRPIEQARADVRILGPAPLAVVRVNNRFRYRIIINCKADSGMRKVVSYILTEFNTDKDCRGVLIYADNDPQD